MLKELFLDQSCLHPCSLPKYGFLLCNTHSIIVPPTFLLC